MAATEETLKTHVYSTFPVEDSNECLATVELECPDDVTPIGVNLIIVTDVSLSMKRSIPSLKCTLEAVGNFILEFPSRNIKLTVITFSTEAEVVFSGYLQKDEETARYFDSVKKIKAVESTNIENGLNLAQKHFDTDKLNGVILLSDGNPNAGIESIDGFKEFVDKLPVNKDLITIGYGDNYNPKLLDSIGRFTYAPSRSEIPSIIGSYLGQLLSTYAFDAKLVMSIPYRLAIGNARLGTLFTGRKYCFGVSIPKDRCEEILASQIKLVYKTFNSPGDIEVVADFYDAREEEIPDEITTLYYQSSASRMIDAITSKGADVSDNMRDNIQKRIDKWDQDLGKESYRRVKKALKGEHNIHRETFKSSTLHNQIGYGDDSSNQTPFQRKCQTRALNHYESSMGLNNVSDDSDDDITTTHRLSTRLKRV